MSNESVSSQPSLFDNKAGHTGSCRAARAFCTGIIPYDGFEVVRAQLEPWLPLEQAYAFIEEHMKSVGRPIQAVCGIEMRQPAPLTLDRWSSFNGPYLEQLRKWGLMRRRAQRRVPIEHRARAASAGDRLGLRVQLYKASFHEGRQLLPLRHRRHRSARQDHCRGRHRPCGHAKARPLHDRCDRCEPRQAGLSWRNAKQVAIFHVHEIPDLWGPAVLGEVGEPCATVCSSTVRGRRSQAPRLSSRRAVPGRN